jgi:L-amino acid N-acyltransferase YncA
MPETWNREIHTQLRRASGADSADILAIYNQSIQRGEIARHCQPLTPADFAGALLPDEDNYPTHVAAVHGVTRGWAGFRPWRLERAAYAFTLELLVYVAPTHRGRGLGKALVTQTIASATWACYHSIIALSLADDPVADQLLRSAGFFFVGCPNALFPGRDELHDVAMYQRMLFGSDRA